MSRHYLMHVEIKGHDPARADDIQHAANKEWNWDDNWREYMMPTGVPVMTCSGESNLGGGESEDEFARSVYLAVWKANKKYCGVTIIATCLEPCAEYWGDEKDYVEMQKSGLLEPDPEDDFGESDDTDASA